MKMLLLGNEFSTLEFQTRSGILKAKQETDKSITLDFPANAPTPFNSFDAKFLQVAVADLDVEEVQYSSTTKKLLIRLADQCKR